MARRGRPKGGRTTPKATSGRYTPPIPREQKVSPLWVPVTMFTCLGLGALVISLVFLSKYDRERAEHFRDIRNRVR